MIYDNTDADIIENIDREIESWVSKNRFEFKLIDKPKFKPKLCIQGLSGAGLSANIAINYILKNFESIKIAGFISELIPPFINFHNSKKEILLPITIFEVKIPDYEEQSILLTLGEVPISDYALYSVAESLYKTYKELGIEQIIHLDTFVSVDDQIDNYNDELPNFYIIGSIGSLASKFDKKVTKENISNTERNNKTFDEIKYLYGFSAACNIIFRDIEVCSILVNVSNNKITDDLATLRMIKILKEIMNLEINVKDISDISQIYDKKQEQLFGVNRNLYYPPEKEITEKQDFEFS